MKLSTRTVKTEHYPVIVGTEMFAWLKKMIGYYRKRKSDLFLLTDSNTHRFCLPRLIEQCPVLEETKVMHMESGEEHKTLRTAEYLWKEMASRQADRHSLLINLGGGVVTDVGGFVASGYHRGIDTIHIPTTLIGQIDAAIGGKTGVNLQLLKNQVGAFHSPQGVFIWPDFLKTLPPAHVRSGLAEVAKTALVRDEQCWRWLSRKSVQELLEVPFDDRFWTELLLKTIRIKLEIVRQDPFERKQRKLLNFGHTVGHAIESLAMRRETPVLHGDAIAAGMICESYLSVECTGLDPGQQRFLGSWLLEGFGKLPLLEEDESVRMDIMRYDKKNLGQEIRFTLLTRIGQGKVNQVCTSDQIHNAFARYYAL